MDNIKIRILLKFSLNMFNFRDDKNTENKNLSVFCKPIPCVKY